ncbi:MAG: SpoVA/SpoVAEb family sporulation membrane protein [Anaeroplasmataceae bacterium]
MYFSKEEYSKMLKAKPNFKMMIKNALMSFLGGGLICLMGQVIYYIFNSIFKLSDSYSTTYTVGVMVLLAGILSAFGIYDKIGQIFKCGTIVPITGFTNATVSAAMEYKPEGIILGVGANAFKLSGAVIALGVFAAYVVGLIRYVVSLL